MGLVDVIDQIAGVLASELNKMPRDCTVTESSIDVQSLVMEVSHTHDT